MRRKPWFKHYFSDSSMQELTLCSLAAQGLWRQMYTIFQQDPVGELAIGPRRLTKDDLFSQSGLSSKDFPMVNLHGLPSRKSSKVKLKVGPEDVRFFFDAIFEELLDAKLFELEDDGRIFAPWLLKREHIRRKRAAGGKLGGNPKLQQGAKDNHRGKPRSLSGSSTTEDNPKERVREYKSPTDSAPNAQRLRIGRILEAFEDAGRKLPKRSIGAWARRLKLYTERHADADAACDALVTDLESIAAAGKLVSSAYALSIVDSQLEQERTGQGLARPGRRADAGAGHDTRRRAAEELD